MLQPIRVFGVLIGALVALAGSYVPARAQSMPGACRAVLTTLDKQGTYSDGVLKVNLPRNDLKVVVDGMEAPPPFGLSGWLALTHGRGQDYVLRGDLILLEQEVNPVVEALLDKGLEVSTVHNQFLFEHPHVLSVNLHGVGDPVELARKIEPALALIGHVPGSVGAQPAAAGIEAVGLGNQEALQVTRLEQIIGSEAQPRGSGVYRFLIGRKNLKVRDAGANLNARMGLNAWAAFLGTDQQAEITGNIVLREQEVAPVTQALLSHGLSVVALYDDLGGTKPALSSLTFWGKSSAVRLALGFRAALDQLQTNQTNLNIESVRRHKRDDQEETEPWQHHFAGFDHY